MGQASGSSEAGVSGAGGEASPRSGAGGDARRRHRPTPRLIRLIPRLDRREILADVIIKHAEILQTVLRRYRDAASEWPRYRGVDDPF